MVVVSSELVEQYQGWIQGAPPLKLEKILFFQRKILIFQTKYPKNFRASLRSPLLF